MKRDFDVTVKNDEKTLKFTGEKCAVRKNAQQRLGLSKKVEETLECDDFEISSDP